MSDHVHILPVATPADAPDLDAALSPTRRLLRAAFTRALAEPAVGMLLLRLVLATIFFGHGAQKVFGWFGGAGPEASAAFFHDTWGITYGWFWLNALTELVGGAMLALGLTTRVWALGLVINMSVAILVAHLSHGLIGPSGVEFPLTLLAVSLAIFLLGAGRLSLDWLLFEPRP